MKRAIFIAAAAGWYLANVGQDDVPALERAMRPEMLEQRAGMLRQIETLTPEEARLVAEQRELAELAEIASVARFGLHPSTPPREPWALAPGTTAEAAPVYRRNPQPKGPMEGFGYSWLDDRLKRSGLARPALLDREAPRDGPSFAYEALNLVDGRRSVGEIHAHLFATVGRVPLQNVADYLLTLQKLGLLERR